ncbi:MAG: family metallopeptidase [Micavibrio sp.]|nr:family metallopeptidase [Micavibrio sp.]
MKKDDLFKTNPLFWALDGSNDFVPAYGHIKSEHFGPAFDFALAEAEAAIANISNSGEAPTFQNTIEALEYSCTRFQYIRSVFDHLSGVTRTPEMEVLEKKLEAKASAFFDKIRFDSALFKRIEAVRKQRDMSGLDEAQSALVEYIYNDFFMNGAALQPAEKEELYRINQSLAEYGTIYDSLMVKYTESGQIVVEERAELLGLPRNLVEEAAKQARKQGLKGQWLFKGDDDTWWQMAIHGTRSLRKRLYEPTFDTDQMLRVIKKMLALRYERARLLGFQSHAEYKIQGRMAENKGEIITFLNELKNHTKPALRRENAMLKEIARADGVEKVERHDRIYYEERLREQVLGLGEKKLRPYLQVENVVAGAFGLTRELFNIEFVRNDTREKWHEDVQCYDVINRERGEKIAMLNLDLYARPEKNGHAWCGTILAHGGFEGTTALPQVNLVCNFGKSTGNEPSLASLDNTTTFFHEMGHAVQAIFTRTPYQALSAFNNIPLDQIELFSQIYENWALEPSILDRYARHFKTGKPIPDLMKEKIRDSRGFMGGGTMKFALEITYLDLALHSRSLKKMSISNFELKILNDLFPGRSRQGIITPVFQHIATYGYDAGYYSYIWSEALDADSFSMFPKDDLFNKDAAKKLLNFYAHAGTRDAKTNYQEFRGRPLTTDALLERYKLRDTFAQAAAPQSSHAPEQDNNPEAAHPPVSKRQRKPAP